MQKMLIALAISALFFGCKEEKKEQVMETPSVPIDKSLTSEKKVPFVWEGANVYKALARTVFPTSKM
jgi:hypothetical protein